MDYREQAENLVLSWETVTAVVLDEAHHGLLVDKIAHALERIHLGSLLGAPEKEPDGQ